MLVCERKRGGGEREKGDGRKIEVEREREVKVLVCERKRGVVERREMGER